MSSPASADVSVIIPCYRQAHYLAGCIRSALSQAGAKVQVVVVNDGSPDDAHEVAASFGDRITYVRQANAGLPAARNAGLAVATGAHVVFLDSDDELLPDAIAAHMKVFAARAEVTVTCGGHDDVDTSGRVLASHAPPRFEPDAFRAIAPGNVAPPVCYAFRADAVRALGNFDCDPALHGHEDWALVLKLAARGDAFATVPASVARYRLSDASMSVTARGRMTESALLLLRRYAAHPRHDSASRRGTRRLITYLVKRRMTDRLRAGRRGEALATLCRSVVDLVRGGEWRFAAFAPLAVLMPVASVRRRWRDLPSATPAGGHA